MILSKINGKPTRAYLRNLDGQYQYVLCYYDGDGIRRSVTKMSGYVVRGNKMRAENGLKEWASQVLTAMQNVNASLASADVASMLLSDYMTDWLRKRKNELQPTTYENYENMLDKRIKPYFDEIGATMGSLTAGMFKAYLEYLQEDLGDSSSTARRHYSLINPCLNYAVQKRHILRNPLIDVGKPSDEEFKPTPYQRSQVLRMLIVFEPTIYYVPVLLGVYYGLRRSEALGLKWENIDFDANVIYIAEKVYESGGKKLENVKSSKKMKTKKSSRALKMTPLVREALLKARQDQETNKSLYRKSYCTKYKEYVCVNQIGELITPHKLTDNFPRILVKNGLPRIRFHDLRHTCATLLLNMGDVNLVKIRDLLGHSDIHTTERYASLNASTNAAAAEKMAEIISEAGIHKQKQDDALNEQKEK